MCQNCADIWKNTEKTLLQRGITEKQINLFKSKSSAFSNEIRDVLLPINLKFEEQFESFISKLIIYAPEFEKICESQKYETRSIREKYFPK